MAPGFPFREAIIIGESRTRHQWIVQYLGARSSRHRILKRNVRILTDAEAIHDQNVRQRRLKVFNQVA